MSHLRANFRQANTLQISVALNAVFAELSSIEQALKDPKNAVIKMALLARRQQLKEMKAALEAQQDLGRFVVCKSENKNFAAAAALVYIFLARQAAEEARKRAQEARQEIRMKNSMNKKARQLAPKFAA